MPLDRLVIFSVVVVALLAIIFFVEFNTGVEKDDLKVVWDIKPDKTIDLKVQNEAQLLVTIENIGKGPETVKVKLNLTEGITCDSVEESTGTLKPEEERRFSFKFKINNNSLPGKYRIDLNVTSATGDSLLAKVFLNVIK